MLTRGATIARQRLPPYYRARTTRVSFNAVMMRAGKSGRSSELLTPAQRRFIDDWCRAKLARLGCDFPYDEAFGAIARG